MKEYYIRMTAPVIPESADSLLKIIDKCMFSGFERIHLMLSTPGGNVAQGISLANYLRGMPIDLYTCNFGAVDSIGVTVYCAGKRRLCSPSSRFQMHPVGIAFINNNAVEEANLTRGLREVAVDTRNIAALISETTNMSPEQVIAAMNSQTILDAQGAIACGLVHEIRVPLMPTGADFGAISRDCSITQYENNSSKNAESNP